MKRKATAKKTAKKTVKKASKVSRGPAKKSPRSGEIRAENVMVKDVVTVREDLPIAGLIREIRTRRFSGFPVVDAEEKAVGVVSQNDVLRALAYAVGAEAPAAQTPEWRKASSLLLEMTLSTAGGAVSELLARPVRDVMTRSVTSVRADAKVADVCDKMVSNRIHRVLVLDSARKVQGLISATDLVKSFGKHLRGR
jgi:CBS domain-containing membrane protein